MRDTVVIGAVGAGGLGQPLREQLSRFDYGVAAALVVLIALALLGAFLASAGFRRGIRLAGSLSAP